MGFWDELAKDEVEFLDTLDLQECYEENNYECEKLYGNKLHDFVEYLTYLYNDDYMEWREKNNKTEQELFDGLSDYDFAEYINKRYGYVVCREVTDPIFTVQFQ